MNGVERAKRCISAGGKVHLVGVGGIGMAGVAALLHARGFSVSGCDLQRNRQTNWLEGLGVSIFLGHDTAHIEEEIDWVIHSTAVPEIHPEIQFAQMRSIPISRRGEVLPALMQSRTSIAVSGTHGKTTTSAMIAQLLDCGYCIGGEVAGRVEVARDAELMVVEADESDGTVRGYIPDISVITNIEYDHMEHHDSPAHFEDCFRSLIEQTRKHVYYCAEDPVARRICEGNPKCIPYAPPEEMPEILPFPGRHNRWNAAAAIAVAQHWAALPEITARLSQLQPIRRRFETVFNKGDIRIISDYAHHPTEIAALIQTAKELGASRILAVFQPHRYTRTRALGKDFPSSFDGVDLLWLVPVYAASESPLEGGTSKDLLKRFSADWASRITYCDELSIAWKNIQNVLRAGDLLLVVGAGDIERLAEWASALTY